MINIFSTYRAIFTESQITMRELFNEHATFMYSCIGSNKFGFEALDSSAFNIMPFVNSNNFLSLA
jgi:hypothetical protein